MEDYPPNYLAQLTPLLFTAGILKLIGAPNDGLLPPTPPLFRKPLHTQKLSLAVNLLILLLGPVDPPLHKETTSLFDILPLTAYPLQGSRSHPIGKRWIPILATVKQIRPLSGRLPATPNATPEQGGMIPVVKEVLFATLTILPPLSPHRPTSALTLPVINFSTTLAFTGLRDLTRPDNRVRLAAHLPVVLLELIPVNIQTPRPLAPVLKATPPIDARPLFLILRNAMTGPLFPLLHINIVKLPTVLKAVLPLKDPALIIGILGALTPSPKAIGRFLGILGLPPFPLKLLPAYEVIASIY